MSVMFVVAAASEVFSSKLVSFMIAEWLLLWLVTLTKVEVTASSLTLNQNAANIIPVSIIIVIHHLQSEARGATEH